MSTRTLKVKVVGDASSVESMFSKLGSSSSSLSSKLTGMASGLFIGGQVLGGLKAAAGGIWGVTNAAADLGEAVSKSEQIFGSAASQVSVFGDKAAAALGMSKTEAVSAASQFGTLIKKTGEGPDVVADMSTAMVGLSSDLASFNNISSDDASQKLFAGLTGEAEPLKQLGIFLSADAVKAKGLAMGLADASGEMSESAKIQARYALIMEQTADAQGDYARTSKSLPNLQRTLGAQFENLKTTIGQGLLPVFTSLLSKVVDVMPAITGAISGFVEKVGPMFAALGDVFSGGGGLDLEGLKARFGDTFGNIGAKLSEFGTQALTMFQTVWPQIRDTLVPILLQISEIFVSFVDLALAVWDRFGGAIMQFVVGTFQAVMMQVQGVLNIIQGIIKVFTSLVTGDWAGLWEGIKQIFAGFVQFFLGSFMMAFERVRLIATVAWGILTALFGSKISEIVGFFAALPGRILGALGNVGSLLVDAGRRVIEGFWNGLKAKWESVKSWLTGITDMIPDWKGPPAKDRKLLTGAGRLVMEGFASGLDSGWSRDVVPTLRGFTNNVAPTLTAAASPALLGVGSGGGAPMTVNINVTNPDPMATVTALNNAVRMHGAGVVQR